VDSACEEGSTFCVTQSASRSEDAEEPHLLPDCDVSVNGGSQQSPTYPRNFLARFRAKHHKEFAEFLATGIAVFLGLSGTLTVSLSMDSPVHYGTYESSCWSWGFAWMFGIYLGGGVSGAHMNPAISISLSLFRGFPWSQCATYVAAQFLASLTAGALAYGIFADSIHHIDPKLESISTSFFSTPQPWVSRGSAVFNQVVASAIMSMAVLSLGDDHNNPPGHGMSALILGLLLTTLKLTLGYNVGSALNPASDFGPRVIAYAIGHRDKDVFGTHWWYQGPWLGTLAGAILGCIIYDSLIFVGLETPINCEIAEKVLGMLRRLCRGRNSTTSQAKGIKEEA
jgi:aquaglyceroporin related protein